MIKALGDYPRIGKGYESVVYGVEVDTTGKVVLVLRVAWQGTFDIETLCVTSPTAKSLEQHLAA